ncbi:hypothetical protein IHC87_18935 [Photobacterium damselae subsp. damselae]|uniref:hypothetical protein n=1 Tax=Photobacterium damselae TaxID=38293 RepID=UPI001F17B5DC|nr:hypothetical protein [Photobacterium damselae]UJZ95529.1 hypothetical protein IHC87_18935 [Photobacterium damselae subsp. damselae]UJZ99456.1 hypothetical protein IHC88_18555 [Photobacterium damselae subsp. damselae]
MLDIIREVLGWTSVAFYISLTIFNSMKFTRYAAFASATNDTAWSILMGWWPKVILNLSVGAINAYRYVKDFTNTSKAIINTVAALMAGGILYVAYVAISSFINNPTISEALQFGDLALILLALYMTELKKYRILMFLSGFVGMAAYYGNPQMMIIKALVIAIMAYKLYSTRNQTEEEVKQQEANA